MFPTEMTQEIRLGRIRSKTNTISKEMIKYKYLAIKNSVGLVKANIAP